MRWLSTLGDLLPNTTSSGWKMSRSCPALYILNIVNPVQAVCQVLIAPMPTDGNNGEGLGRWI